MHSIDSDPAMVSRIYREMEARLAIVRRRLSRPLTLTE